MISNSRTFGCSFGVPQMFFFSSIESSAGFPNVTPRTICTGNFIHDVGLRFHGRSKLCRFPQCNTTNNLYREFYTRCWSAIPWKIEDHLRNTKTAAKGSRIANHAWSNNHVIDFENASDSIIDKGTFRTRKTLEAWHTKVTPNADNNSCPLPGQYNILFNKHS